MSEFIRSFFILACLTLLPLTAEGQEIARLNEEGFRLLLSRASGQGAESYKLSVTPFSHGTATRFASNVFVLENPVRLVIDVPGVRAKRSTTLDVRNSRIGTIRTGVHPDKTRFVVDIDTEKAPEYSVKTTARGEITVLLSFEEKSLIQAQTPPPTPKEIPQAPPPQSLPIPAPLPEAQKKPEAKIPAVPPIVVIRPTRELPPPREQELDTPTPAPPTPATSEKEQELWENIQFPAEPEELPVSNGDSEEPLTEASAPPIVPPTPAPVAPTPLVRRAPPPQPPLPPVAAEEPQVVAQLDHEPPPPTPEARTIIERIEFKKNTAAASASANSAIVIRAHGLNQYTLSKREANTYEVILEGARLSGQHLTFAQFPPDDFRGFEGVVAQERDNSVVIKIYTEPNATLSPFRKDQELWIQADF